MASRNGRGLVFRYIDDPRAEHLQRGHDVGVCNTLDTPRAQIGALPVAAVRSPAFSWADARRD